MRYAIDLGGGEPGRQSDPDPASTAHMAMSARRSRPRSPRPSTSAMLYRTLRSAAISTTDRAACAAACRACAGGAADGRGAVAPRAAGRSLSAPARIVAPRRWRSACWSARGGAVYALACFVTGAFALDDLEALLGRRRPQPTAMNDSDHMRVVSGIQPTGNLHLGNYLGAIKQWVAMQDRWAGRRVPVLPRRPPRADRSRSCPRELRANDDRDGRGAARLRDRSRRGRSCSTRRACPRMPSCAWLLNGTARMGWLNRMTQWKDKAGKNREGASVGLFTYPVLQAADVLLYQATHVPVGEDQKQHLELARDIATKFNNDFGVELFTLPEPLIARPRRGSCSLRDGAAKMSKSDPSDAVADQPDRRRRHDRRRRSARRRPIPSRCRRRVEALAERPEATQPGDDLRRAGRPRRRPTCSREFAGKGFGRSSRAGRSRGREARPDPRPADAACSTIAPRSARSWNRARRRRARWPHRRCARRSRRSGCRSEPLTRHSGEGRRASACASAVERCRRSAELGPRAPSRGASLEHECDALLALQLADQRAAPRRRSRDRCRAVPRSGAPRGSRSSGRARRTCGRSRAASAWSAAWRDTSRSGAAARPPRARRAETRSTGFRSKCADTARWISSIVIRRWCRRAARRRASPARNRGRSPRRSAAHRRPGG